MGDRQAVLTGAQAGYGAMDRLVHRIAFATFQAQAGETYSIVVDNAGPGIGITGLYRVEAEIDGCVIGRNKGEGILVQETSAGTKAQKLDITSSTLFRNTHGLRVLGRTASPAAFRVRGCTVADNTTSGIEKVNIADAIHILSYLFVTGSPLPAAPFPTPGMDPTPDTLPDCL